MSNALAIATITAVLKHLLNDWLVTHQVSTAVGAVTLSTLPPDRIKTGENESSQLNLFLYHVAPNPAWRNAGLPSRDQGGVRLSNPPLALDLYYLLTAYGKNDLEIDILLGHAVQLLHEKPVLTREAIRKWLTTARGGSGVEQALSTSELAEQVEMIKLCPQPMSTEEISKLWAAFQTNYRPSVAYQASVVLIESKYPTRSPLPVLSRGRSDPTTGRDGGVIAQPDLLPPFPTLQEAIPPAQQPAVRMGEVLTLSGHHLAGDQVAVRFTHARSTDTLKLPVLPGATSTKIQVQIPPDPDPPPSPAPAADSPQNPDNWRVGVYSVAAAIQRAGQPERTTNELVVALAPRIKSIPPPSVAGNVVTLTVACSPKVWQTQGVTLVAGDREIAAEPMTSEKAEKLTFKAKSGDLPSGEQWVRLRVDGVESLLIKRAETPPVFDPTQKVTIP
jgi:hypothetical protein